LRSEFDAGIPEEVLVRLDQMPRDTREIRLFGALTSPPRLDRILQKKWIIHGLSMRDASLWKKAALFPAFLQKDFYEAPFLVGERIKAWADRRRFS
jgi:hypothetical protein